MGELTAYLLILPTITRIIDNIVDSQQNHFLGYEKSGGGAMTVVGTNDSLDQLHADMAAGHMAPTWVHVSEFVAAQPRVFYRPWLWRWDDVIPYLERAGTLVAPGRGSERRSMEHVNPDLGPQFATSHTIATAFQLVRAGETAPAHRHAAGAIRFAARSAGGSVFTRVEGERLMMEENDLLLTPSWTWHEHANETDHDIIWLDALDFPLVNLMQASLFEPGEGPALPSTPDNFSEFRLGRVRPVGWAPYPDHHPVLRYAWADTFDSLQALRGEAGSPFDGILLAYTNPVTSGPTLPTLSCRAQLLRRGEHTRAHRTMSSTVYFVISGSGSTIIDGVRFPWGRGDVFVVPTWQWHEHIAAAGDAYLFSITDQPVMEMLGLYREQPLPDGGGHQEVSGTFAGAGDDELTLALR
jgi:gentisate 1,2-dioxygenase